MGNEDRKGDIAGQVMPMRRVARAVGSEVEKPMPSKLVDASLWLSMTIYLITAVQRVI